MILHHYISFSSQVEPAETTLLVTEPIFNLPNIQETYDQIAFELYQFDSFGRVTSKVYEYYPFS